MQREWTENLLSDGTIQLKKRVLSIKAKGEQDGDVKNFDTAKMKQTVKLMVEFVCDQITDIGGIREVLYKKELSDLISD